MACLQDDVNTYGFTIFWRIENFECEPPTDFSVKSQVFKIRCLDSNWQIELEAPKSFLSAYLFKETRKNPLNLHYSLSVLTGSGWTTVLHNAKDRFRSGGDGYGGDIVDLNLLKREEWFYLPNGSLTISFHIWNAQLKNESSQRLMISRLIDGDYLRHRPIQTFSTLKPNDLFSFPLSYEFKLNPVPNAGLQKINEWKTPQNYLEESLVFENLGTAEMSRVNLQQTKEVLCSQTKTNYTFEDLQASSRSSLNLQNSKEVKTQHTQTDINFKDIDELRNLLKEKEFSLVTLQTPTKQFSVLRTVLCAKSPVFKAMFERKMLENANNLVEISDIKNETLELLVKYLQLEPLDGLKWEEAISLYYPADKYQMDTLKELCTSLLKKELSIDNICDLLRLADLHQYQNLMVHAEEYFCKNFKAILLTPQWKEMLVNTELVAKLLCKLAITN